ncbi:MAG: CaiB/BaiF CoA transferase family protein [Halobacteriales archaeon]
MSAEEGLLSEVTVLDVTQVVAGSFASMALADMGAEVIKIERPDGGDIGRSMPPFVGEMSSYFSAVNRNKRSVAVDLSTADGQTIIRDLAAEADVLVENHPAGRMAKFGLDYDALSEVNPAIIYCSITGFGQTGPYASIPALDMMAQAMSGHMSLTGPPDGKPYRAGLPIGDLTGSMYAVSSILGALYKRAIGNGEGQYIDVSMTDGLIAWLSVRAGYTFATGEAYPRTGNALQEYVPYDVFETADGYLAVIVATEAHWRKLCTGIGRPELAEDDRFATMADRREHREAVTDHLSEALADRSAIEWFETLAPDGVPIAPVYDTKEVWADDHVTARGLKQELSVSGESFGAIDFPVKFSETPTSIRRGVPKLGADTRELLTAHGYDDETIAQLIADGVVGTPETVDD